MSISWGDSALAALTGHWRFDDNAANTTLVATVGANGSLLGGANTADRSAAGPGGALVRSLDLDGSADYCDIDDFSFTTGNAFSFSLWFETDATTGTHSRLAGRTSSNVSALTKNGDTTINFETDTSGTLAFTVPSLGNTAWHHLLVTRTTGNSVRVFVDGVESSSGAQTAAGTWQLQAVGRVNTFRFNGKVANAKVFNTDESANVAALYAENRLGGMFYYQSQ